MPADAGVQHRRPRRLHGARQPCHLVPGRAVRHQINQADPVDHDEIRPHRRPDPAHHLDRQQHPVLIIPAPPVLPVVHMAHQKLIQEIPLRPHDLDAVIARVLRPSGCHHHVGDLFFNPRLIQCRRYKGRDRRLDSRGRDTCQAIGIPPGMQDLHGNPPALAVHPFGDKPVVGDVGSAEKSRRPRKHPAFAVRCHAPRHHQPDPAPGPRRIEPRHPRPVAGLFQPGVHRAHQHAIGQGHAAQGDR